MNRQFVIINHFLHPLASSVNILNNNEIHLYIFITLFYIRVCVCVLFVIHDKLYLITGNIYSYIE